MPSHKHPFTKKIYNYLDFIKKHIIIEAINKDPFLIGGTVSF